jgi:hypothetical protein
MTKQLLILQHDIHFSITKGKDRGRGKKIKGREFLYCKTLPDQATTY